MSQAAGALQSRLSRLRERPNPIWVRELKQSARLGRTPIILMIAVSLLSLLMCTIGGSVGMFTEPATVGRVLFQTFFSVAYFIVTFVGPAIAAGSIASEHEHRTWETLLLTGMGPAQIARGKFASVLSTLCVYLVALAPLGALPFLFGGITVLEVVVAFAILFAIAVWATAFGLAMSSRSTRSSTATVVTVLVVMVASPAFYLAMGSGLSIGAHALWPRVSSGAPIWLPAAYATAPLGVRYLVFLVGAPLAFVGLPTWFFYEVTVANLMNITDDRSSGLKRWYVVTASSLVGLFVAIAALLGDDSLPAASISGLAVFCVFLLFAVVVFAGEPLGPSRRVIAQYERERAGGLRRLLGPSLTSTYLLVLVSGIAGIGALTVVDALLIYRSAPHTFMTHVAELTTCAVCWGAFFVFVVGYTAWLRARPQLPSTARAILLVTTFLLAAIPWLVAGVVGAVNRNPSGALAAAAPSPFYALQIISSLESGDAASALQAGSACAFAWTVLGLVLLGVAARRSAKIVADHDLALDRAAASLAERAR